MITVVSGLPRSGTSLLMQMLAAGGLSVLTDGIRAPDEDNPRGYFEWERIRTLPKDAGCILEAEGKAVKVISSLLAFLPAGPKYKILFVRRPIEQVAASQASMIARRRTQTATADPAAMQSALDSHLRSVTAWLRSRPDLEVCWMEHSRVLADPTAEADAIRQFLGEPLDVRAMAAQVVPALYRQRSNS